MKRILFFLLLLPFYTPAQQTAYNLNQDTLKKVRDLGGKKIWKFHLGDSAAYSDPGYKDDTWTTTFTDFLIAPEYKYNPFSSIGWFRLRFTADSAVTNIPLAFQIKQYGASEIFLDGKKILFFGVIKGKDSSFYVNPGLHSAAFVITRPGEHLLAIRYANYDAKKNFVRYRLPFSGFSITLGKADDVANNNIANLDYTSFFTILLFAIFITLTILHLFLFLYDRSVRSNLYFSVFCLTLGLISILIYSSIADSNPHIARFFFYGMNACIATLIFSLSGFSNELFSRKKLRFKIIAVLTIMAFVYISFINYDNQLPYLILFILVLLESIVLTISGIVRKIRGARIMGFGIIFFAGFVLSMFTVGLIRHGLEFQGESGLILAYIAFCAILSIPASMSVYLSWNVSAMNKTLKKHLEQVENLSAQAIEQEKEKKRILEGQKEMLEREVAARTVEIEKQHGELKVEKKKSDDLLLNILPAEVAEELKEKGFSKARLFDHVTVLFTDFVDFTNAGERMAPDELVSELDTCFKAFDEIISRYSIEKIKTIGDAYLAVCGLPEATPDHAVKVAMAALEIVQYMSTRQQQLGNKTFEVRVGIHSGSVVAGIVGVKKFAYDIWGDTVNTAARMEQHSESGKINISQTTYDIIESKFACTYRGKIQAKNKGELSMYFIEKAFS